MSQSLYQQLASSLAQEIQEGRWQALERLPSLRQIANQRNLSLNTVIKALHLLEAQGLVVAKPKSGYFVSAQPAKSSSPPPITTLQGHLKPTEVTLPKLFQDIMARGAAFDIFPTKEITTPDNNLAILNRHIGRAARQQANNKANYYDNPAGDQEVRQQISNHYRNRNLIIEADEICITSGCQNAIFMALMASCNPGDNVAVESPAFYGVLQLLEALNLNIIEIPSCPENGIDVDMLASAAEQWSIKACVVTPSYATPTGACISPKKQQQIIDIANEKNITIIEDDVYGELGFHRQISPIKSLDKQDRVVLCGSFSKCLSRDLRIGWIVGGRWQPAITQLKLVTQLASNRASQQGLASFLAEGYFRRHLATYRQTLQVQRDQLIDALISYWPDSIRYTVPDGGLALWVQLTPKMDTSKLYLEALKQRIILTPGMLFSVHNQYKNYLRLSFNHPIEGERLKAIRALAQILEK